MTTPLEIPHRHRSAPSAILLPMRCAARNVESMEETRKTNLIGVWDLVCGGLDLDP